MLAVDMTLSHLIHFIKIICQQFGTQYGTNITTKPQIVPYFVFYFPFQYFIVVAFEFLTLVALDPSFMDENTDIKTVVFYILYGNLHVNVPRSQTSITFSRTFEKSQGAIVLIQHNIP